MLKAEVAHLSLRREADKMALLRLEDSTRTPKEFEVLINEWDRIERNHKRRIKRYENNWHPRMLDDMKEDFETGTVAPRPLDHAWWRQLQAGNFLDTIFDCPHQLDELTANARVSNAIKKLKPEQKEVLYYRAIRQWSHQRIAAYRGQTDRNVRKLYVTLIAKLHRELERGK